MIIGMTKNRIMTITMVKKRIIKNRNTENTTTKEIKRIKFVI